MKTDLSSFNNSDYNPGPGILKRTLWYFVNWVFCLTPFPWPSGLKATLLKLFGAKVGKGLVLKPRVNIKYPWKLEIGNQVWIGEEAWIDNLDQVTIKDNVCISQGAMLLCGNHNYKRPTFDLITQPITLEEGSWVGAKATVCPGVTLLSHSILTVGSVASSSLESFGIYKGTPAILRKKRRMD